MNQPPLAVVKYQDKEFSMLAALSEESPSGDLLGNIVVELVDDFKSLGRLACSCTYLHNFLFVGANAFAKKPVILNRLVERAEVSDPYDAIGLYKLVSFIVKDDVDKSKEYGDRQKNYKARLRKKLSTMSDPQKSLKTVKSH